MTDPADGLASAKDPAKAPSREARDTAAGCRNLAADDRLRAAATGTENGRQVLERSAASWETRANGIEAGENDSEQQRAADRALWESGEQDDAGLRALEQRARASDGA